uniref:Alliinase C-terminal domain-containing protein n=1 Tax=Physcomitrium patens TaxID=3218 RepID=A0A2K1KTA8_PHYPA|nr:hypothetical protein PHYPA_003994 [Physcomitrium patens]
MILVVFVQSQSQLYSKLFHWGGDPSVHQPKTHKNLTQVITSLNNPCGRLRERYVPGRNGDFVHDLAQHWRTFITITQDHRP